MEIAKDFNDETFDMIVTDPPFNISYHYKSYKDHLEEEKYYSMLSDMVDYKPTVIIHYAEQLHKLSIKLGYPPKKIVSWVYNSNTSKQHRQIAFYNMIPDFKKVGQPYKNLSDKRIIKRMEEGKTARLYDWWNINQVKNVSKEKTSHPCQMPLKVMDNIIGILPDNITILDPFVGTGTTLLSCIKKNLPCIGVACKRIEEELNN
jgi:adenine-specific DNA-methyltransferase